MDEPSKHTWSGESDKLLEQIRLSSLTLYKEHKNNYLYLVNISNKLTLIIIICSLVSAFFNFGLKPYFTEQIISLMKCCESRIKKSQPTAITFKRTFQCIFSTITSKRSTYNFEYLSVFHYCLTLPGSGFETSNSGTGTRKNTAKISAKEHTNLDNEDNYR